jgi:hypothetical protein
VPSILCVFKIEEFLENTLPPPEIPKGIGNFGGGSCLFRISGRGRVFALDVILSTPANKSHFCFQGTVEVRNGEKVKTEPDGFEDEDKKPLEDKDEGGRFNACDVKTEPEGFSIQIQFLTFTAANALIL